METTPLGKCKNCGAELEPLNRTLLKCPYCGTTYQISVPVLPAPPDQNKVNESISTTDQQPPKPKRTGRGVVFILFLIIIGWLVFFINQSHNDATANSSAITTPDIVAHYPNPDSLEEAKKQHFKRVNPDPQIAIKRLKIKRGNLLSYVSVTFQNNTNPDEVINDIEFTVQFFDKNGLEIKSADQFDRSSAMLISANEKSTNEWQLYGDFLKAKTAKVKLKKVGLGDNIVWDY